MITKYISNFFTEILKIMHFPKYTLNSFSHQCVLNTAHQQRSHCVTHQIIKKAKHQCIFIISNMDIP